jgi:hypothetical protein
MGMYDNVVFLDQPPRCPAGHPVGGFQTKSFPDPSMSTYLVQGGRVVLAERGPWEDEDERSAWRISGGEVIHERRYALKPVSPPSEVLIYSCCPECEPVLVRVDHPRAWGDIVEERRLEVDIRLTFREGEPAKVERVSGDRGALVEELRRAGLRVLSDDDPLAIAHREIKRAREEAGGRGRGPR